MKINKIEIEGEVEGSLEDDALDYFQIAFEKTTLGRQILRDEYKGKGRITEVTDNDNYIISLVYCREK